jgi:hypothetical protein
MANNRELAQFGSYVTINESDNTVGVGTSVIVTGGVFVGGVQAIRPNGTWGGSSAGIQGATGIQGTAGTQGITGAQGTTGTQGATGSQGTSGAQGAIGTQGATGSQGTTGTTGTQGTTGTTGSTGAQGVTGIGPLLFTSNATGSNRSLNGDSGWQTHLSGTVSLSKTSNILVIATFSMTYEVGSVQSMCRLIFNGGDYGGFCFSKQSTANMGGSASGTWTFSNFGAGNYSYELQVRNTQGGTTTICNYWDGGLGDSYSRDTIMFIYQ